MTFESLILRFQLGNLTLDLIERLLLLIDALSMSSLVELDLSLERHDLVHLTLLITATEILLNVSRDSQELNILGLGE